MTKIKLKFRFRFSMQQSAGKHGTEHCPLARVIRKMPGNNRPQIVIENRNILLTVNVSINWDECSYSKVGNTAPKHSCLYLGQHHQSGWSRFFVSTNLYFRFITKNDLSPVVFNRPVYFRPTKSKSSFQIEQICCNFLGHRPAFET